MRIFKGLENIHTVIDQHVAEWRKEQGEPPEQPETISLEERIKLHTTGATPIKPEAKPRDPNRFINAEYEEPVHNKSASTEPVNNNEPEIISVIKHKEEGHHSWLYKEVLKAIKDAAGDGHNTKIIAVFVPVVQNGKEFEDLPATQAVTLSSSVPEEFVNIDIPDPESEAHLEAEKQEISEPETINNNEEFAPEATEEIVEAEPEVVSEIESAEPEVTEELESQEPETTSEVEDVVPEATEEIVETEPEVVSEIESAEPEVTEELESQEPETTSEIEDVVPEATEEIVEAEPEVVSEIESTEPEVTEELESQEPETTSEIEDVVPEAAEEIVSEEPEVVQELEEAEGFDDILPEGQDEPDEEEAEAFRQMEESLDESLREKAEELAQEVLDAETEAVVMPDFPEIDETDDLLPAEDDEEEEISVGEPMEFTEIPIDDTDAEIEFQPDSEEQK